MKFPLAPEKKVVRLEQMSSYQRSIIDEEDIKETKNPRLILDMKNKYNYVIHYRLLQFYVRIGMRITHIHRIVSFKEEAWLGSYINFNTQQRTAASSAFEKDLFKMMSNAFYGKTLDNIRHRRNVTLVRDSKDIRHQASKGTFVDYDVLSPDLTMISHKNTSVKFDKPIYLGMCVLDYSKLLMYEFYYDVLEKLWPHNMLHYHDTDSLVLSVPCTKEELQEDLMSIRDDHLDTSDYPESHPLYSLRNKKVPGVFKDEMLGKRMTEFIALKSKVYSYRTGEEDVRKAKGVCRATIRKHLQFEDYTDALYKRQVINTDNIILSSDKHKMYMSCVRRKALSPFDPKRFIYPDGVATDAYI